MTEISEESSSSTPQSSALEVQEEKIHSLIIDLFAVTIIDSVGIQCLRQVNIVFSVATVWCE